jgi:hypothetical protein
MSPKELFALIVRVIGLLGAIYLIRHIVKIGVDTPTLLVVRLASALVGLYMVRGAPLLVKFAYPEKAGEGTAKTG